MKLSELRQCDKCRGPVAPVFHVLRQSLAIVDQRVTNSVLGVAGVLGGLQNRGALRIAEVMAPDDQAVMIAGEKDPVLWSELVLCSECYAGLDVAGLFEARGEQLEREAAKRGEHGPE